MNLIDLFNKFESAMTDEISRWVLFHTVGFRSPDNRSGSIYLHLIVEPIKTPVRRNLERDLYNEYH